VNLQLQREQETEAGDRGDRRNGRLGDGEWEEMGDRRPGE